MLRDHGTWHEQQLVSRTWIDGMHGCWIITGSGPPFDRYGIATWAGPRSCWRLDGANGQYVIIDESCNAAVTITAHESTRDHRLAELAVEALTTID